MRKLSIDDYREYYSLIKRDHTYLGEWGELIELLVNCESSFFRDIGAFETLMDELFPELVETCSQRRDQSLAMWSAGCSRGQEAYSLAMACAETYGNREPLAIRVTGTDVSINALARATTGEYSYSDVRHMGQTLIDKYMKLSTIDGDCKKENGQQSTALNKHLARYRVRENISRKVEFGFLNLNDFSDYWVPLQDLIFCQNVLIYFSLQGRAQTISMLLDHLKPDGYLFLTPGDAVGMKVRGATVFRFKDIQVYKRHEEGVDVQIRH
jgi:chemotaxis methyl-accepting protein methylase